MALIECPNCKKQVSDTRESCFHCGYKFQTAPIETEEKNQDENIIEQQKRDTDDSLTNFSSLRQIEKDKLWDEFYAKNPKYWKLKNKAYNIDGIRKVTGLCLIPLLVNELIFRNRPVINKEFFTIASVMYALLMFGGLIVAFSCIYAKSVCNKKALIVLKRFQNWLKTEKQIEYVVKFNRNQRKEKIFFDSINIEFESF